MLLITQNNLTKVVVYESKLRSHENQLSEASWIRSTTPFYSSGDQNTII